MYIVLFAQEPVKLRSAILGLPAQHGHSVRVPTIGNWSYIGLLACQFEPLFVAFDSRVVPSHLRFHEFESG